MMARQVVLTALVAALLAALAQPSAANAPADADAPAGSNDENDANDENDSDDARAAVSRGGAELGGVLGDPHAPSVGAVLAAAYRAAELDGDPGRGWVLRARLAGLVPWVTVRTGRDTSWQDERSEVGHGTSFEVRATWRLDRLLFDGRELQIASIEAARRRERQRLAPKVIRAYFAWRRAAGAPTKARAAGARRPQIAEAVAELDALTDGWFSEELARSRR